MRATPLDQVWYTSSWRPTRCRTSFGHTNSAWRAIRHYSMSTFRQCGLRQTTVTGVATLLAYSRWARAAPCSSMYSRQPPRMNGMGQAIKPRRVQEGRCVKRCSTSPRHVPTQCPLYSVFLHSPPFIPFFRSPFGPSFRSPVPRSPARHSFSSYVLLHPFCWRCRYLHQQLPEYFL